MSESIEAKIPFAPRTSVEQVEESDQLAPKFDENGCIPCITTHAETREVLMFAFMNSEALRLTVSSASRIIGPGPARSSGRRASPPACFNMFSASSSMMIKIA